MSTLLEILQKTTTYLAGKGVPNPKLHAELLLAHVLHLRRLDLYLQFDRPLTPDQLDALRPLVLRRGKREPLEYIIGNRPFADIELLCDRRALIPRSETEELVELLVKHFATRPSLEKNDAPSLPTPLRVLDLGTGTGALALALAKRWPQAQVTAVDASAEALALARSNAEHNDLSNRVTFVSANWFAPVAKNAAQTQSHPLASPQEATSTKNTVAATAATLPNTTTHQSSSTASQPCSTASPCPQHLQKNTFHTAPTLAGQRFDLIVSNPPYLTQAEWQAADPEVKDYEPYGALVAANNGLADLQAILATAPQFLAPGGLLALETGIAHHEALAQLADATGAYATTESHRDSDDRPRFFLATLKS